MPSKPRLCRVTAFEAVAPYTLRVEFDDKTAQVIDFEPILAGQLYGPLREQALFEAKADAVGSGVDALASMLSDDRSMHRLAGAWLAWKVRPAGGPLRLPERWPEIVGRIAEVAQSDVEPKVRARAARCAQLVEASLAAASMHAPGTLMLDSGI